MRHYRSSLQPLFHFHSAHAKAVSQLTTVVFCYNMINADASHLQTSGQTAILGEPSMQIWASCICNKDRKKDDIHQECWSKRGTMSECWCRIMQQKILTADWHYSKQACTYFDISKMVFWIHVSSFAVGLGETFWDFQIRYSGLLLTSSGYECKTWCVNLLSHP